MPWTYDVSVAKISACEVRTFVRTMPLKYDDLIVGRFGSAVRSGYRSNLACTEARRVQCGGIRVLSTLVAGKHSGK